MTTKKKIILTILLAVLVGVLIFGIVGLIMQIDNTKAIATHEALYRTETVRKYYLGQYYDLISKILLTIIVDFLFILCIIGIWLNWFIPQRFINEYKEKQQERISLKKEEKKKKLQEKLNNL